MSSEQKRKHSKGNESKNCYSNENDEKNGNILEKSNCNARVKIKVLDAVIRSKILYGMESAQLNDPHLNRLQYIQLKGLRKIPKITTTYIDRHNSNEKVYEIANRELLRAKKNQCYNSKTCTYNKEQHN